MPDKPIIRLATPEDEAKADACVKRIFPDDPHTYANNVRLPAHTINVLAETDSGEVIGYASALIEATPQHGPQEWRKYPLYIGVVAILEEYRMQGIAGRLFALIAQQAKIRAPHHKNLHLHVSTVNESAITAFQKIGFEKVSLYTSKTGEQAHLMRTARERLE